jgi:hypothetical protein
MEKKLREEIYPEFKVGLIHSRLKEEEKRETMEAFSRGELKVLVATSVVEVGVDVPNAAAMVVEHAERFGLAALHQLRGRVGRGDRSVLLLPGLFGGSDRRGQVPTQGHARYERRFRPRRGGPAHTRPRRDSGHRAIGLPDAVHRRPDTRRPGPRAGPCRGLRVCSSPIRRSSIRANAPIREVLLRANPFGDAPSS